MYDKIKDLPESERPLEKFLSKGAEALSDAELLAIILRTGARNVSALALAGDILASTDYGILGVYHMSFEMLTGIKGVGRVKALQLKAIGELSRRIVKASIPSGVSFLEPSTIASYYMEDMRHLTQEQLLVAFLNTKGVLIKEEIITKGTVNMSIVSPREIFICALKCEAVSVVMLHNHPSGDPAPSRQDIEATLRVREAGALMGVSLIDHIIIGDNNYISFREEGLL